MSILVLQHSSTTISFTSGTSGTAAPAFTGNTTPGSCLVAAISLGVPTGAPTVSGVTTNGTAESWAAAATEPQGSFADFTNTSIWVNPNTGGGQKTIDIASHYATAMSTTNKGTVLVDIFEIAGLGASSVVDKVKVGTGSGTSWSSGATATTAQASEIAIGVGTAFLSSTLTMTGPASPWTNETSLSSTFGGSTSQVNFRQIAGFNILSATGTATYSGTDNSGSASSAAVVVTLMAAPPPALVASSLLLGTFL